MIALMENLHQISVAIIAPDKVHDISVSSAFTVPISRSSLLSYFHAITEKVVPGNKERILVQEVSSFLGPFMPIFFYADAVTKSAMFFFAATSLLVVAEVCYFTAHVTHPRHRLCVFVAGVVFIVSGE